jgi:hypothetical protein
MKRGILFAAVFALALAGTSAASAAVVIPSAPSICTIPAPVVQVRHRIHGPRVFYPRTHGRHYHWSYWSYRR